MHTAILSQRTTETLVSTVITMTEALDINRPDTLNVLTGNKKMASQKTREHQQLSRHLDSANFFKLQSLK